jgi:hypothetical protein
MLLITFETSHLFNQELLQGIFKTVVSPINKQTAIYMLQKTHRNILKHKTELALLNQLLI